MSVGTPRRRSTHEAPPRAIACRDASTLARMNAGYSGRPLTAKLGIEPGMSVVVLDPPAGYMATLGPLPAGAEVRRAAGQGEAFIQLFTRSRQQLGERLARLRPALAAAGMLWVSWPKRASGVATDVTEDVVRALALANGLVDVKVCAIDETWSGLKLVIPVKDRAAG
ncbi:MAG TPA: DUF3052 domain-containing protein [Thermoanaerobaculia bacterium]|nr:DUF3052 domain-containing protein [Thermoanaerobaculia bacterium]